MINSKRPITAVPRSRSGHDARPLYEANFDKSTGLNPVETASKNN